jgi:hypothetical protein
MHGGDSDTATCGFLEREPDRRGRDFRPVDADHDPAGRGGGERGAVSVRVDDDHRTLGVRGHCGADRPHQQATEATNAPAADDHQLCVSRLAQQRRCGGGKQLSGDLDVG